MFLPPYEFRRKRYCSRSCQGRAKIPHLNRVRRPPKNHPSAFKPGQQVGPDNPMYVPAQGFICEHCRQPFELKPWQVRHHLRWGGLKIRFCGRKCFSASGAFRGEKSTSWVGGSKTYRGRSWIRARLAAVKRDNGTCQFCGKVIGVSIPVHHVRPYRDFDSDVEANAIDNLICACQSCHMKNEPRPTRSHRHVNRGRDSSTETR